MSTEPTPNRPAPVILVIGATGNQGGAVVDALLRTGAWTVRALTRDPAGRAARALAKRGVTIAAGDMDDAGSLKGAISGAYGVFSVQNSRTAGRSGEVRQGRNVIDAAEAAGSRHLVYTSVGGAERVRGIPHFDTKWEIEQHLRTTGLTWTILRPTTFTSVFTLRGASVGLSMMAAALGPTKTLQTIAVPDIGVFARLAFERPEQFAGQALELAGDELTIAQIAQTLRGAGRRIRYTRLPKPLLKLAGPEAKMLFWFGETGYAADIPALRRIHPGLLTLDQWLTQPQD
ncbi:NmrA/HSCARG family protein [Plantactinospora sp. S1510]|uniref:NmrA/HSCARG family protein n=1 Tax=Plantactinospora alkalitolerans TaxID=2789879 RepID=A0ABS0H7E6_9ACTN|nr:NmrA/HSCARG family protein [Plantactinospora alkalitolerans]MBF9134391.1 NmrA/HSCARG family protein [Plantactinospora alkalitolerans]